MINIFQAKSNKGHMIAIIGWLVSSLEIILMIILMEILNINQKSLNVNIIKCRAAL